MDINVTRFKTRGELEVYIQSLGDTSSVKLVGKEKQLAYFNLSSKRKIYGVPCIALGEKKNDIILEKPNRGELHPYGINKRDIKHDK